MGCCDKTKLKSIQKKVKISKKGKYLTKTKGGNKNAKKKRM